MNIQTKPPLTVAEQTLVDAFARRADRPGDRSVANQRETLLAALGEHGLPTRRIESWHYTDLRNLLRAVPAATAAVRFGIVAPLVEGSFVLPVEGGIARDLADDLPAGVSATPYRDRLQDGSAARLMAERGSDDAIGRINGAFATDGFVVDFADGTVLDKPVELQVLHGAGQAHTRFPVTVGANVSATVIERHDNADPEAALITSITDLTIGSDSTLVWIIVQTQGSADSHLGQINIRLQENARLTLHVVNAGGKLVRQEIHAVTDGEGADLQLRGVNLLGGDSHTDVTLTLGHDVPNTTSTEVFRNVVFDKARGVFQGQIRVAPDAQKTDARMACNTLLLSDEAEFATKPELEIFADDVQCAHGATVADIDDNHLFYLMSRGVSEKSARALLIQAFVNEIAEELDDEALVEALHGIIETWLEKHG